MLSEDEAKFLQATLIASTSRAPFGTNKCAPLSSGSRNSGSTLRRTGLMMERFTARSGSLQRLADAKKHKKQ
jgi:hypothetical protein